MQDDIRVSQSLTVSLGLRHEFQQHLDDKLNFAPRFSIAWAPFQNRKTVIRAGGGIFFNRLSADTYANTLRYDNQTQETITIFNPVYINPLPADLSALSSNITTQQSTTRQILDPDLRAPYYINSMFSIEQQLPKALVGTISYSFNRGIHLFRTRNINAPLPETGLRPDPEQGNIYATESSGKSIRHELAFGISRRFSTRFTFFSNYRLAWAMDDSAFPADNYNLKTEWARSSIDRRHSFNMVLMINLPWGIRIIPNLFINSGAPFNITTGLDDNLDGQFNDRPAGIGRNSDLPPALYPLVPRPDRLVSVAGGPTLTLIDYLNTYYPNGLRADLPSRYDVKAHLRNGQVNGNADAADKADDRGSIQEISASIRCIRVICVAINLPVPSIARNLGSLTAGFDHFRISFPSAKRAAKSITVTTEKYGTTRSGARHSGADQHATRAD